MLSNVVASGDRGKDAAGPSTALNRGLWPLCAAKVPLPRQDATFRWVLRPDGDLFVGAAYTDGSLVDGKPAYGDLCCRYGWAFVVIGSDCEVIASANGVPPAGTLDVFGAELWDLRMAIAHAKPKTNFYTDCLSVLRRLEAGRASTVAASSVYALNWRAVCDGLDRLRGIDGGVDIVWMPSHTREVDVGVLARSDGNKFAALDSMANGEADVLAEAAVDEFRVP